MPVIDRERLLQLARDRVRNLDFDADLVSDNVIGRNEIGPADIRECLTPNKDDEASPTQKPGGFDPHDAPEHVAIEGQARGRPFRPPGQIRQVGANPTRYVR